jgi:HEPN domain-containing protein
LIQKKEYPLAAFSLEQAIQLRLKHFLGTKVGDFPRTHPIKSLIQECTSLCERLSQLERREGTINLLGDVDAAYIMSRYYPTIYTDEEVSNMRRLYEELVQVLDACLL